MLKKQLLLVSTFYSVTLVTLSLINLNDKKIMIKNEDKLYHCIAYFVFTILWYYTFNHRFSLNKTKALRLAFFASIFFGVLIELLQEFFTKYREGDVNDIVANTLGTLLALLMLILLKKRRVR